MPWELWVFLICVVEAAVFSKPFTWLFSLQPWGVFSHMCSDPYSAEYSWGTPPAGLWFLPLYWSPHSGTLPCQVQPCWPPQTLSTISSTQWVWWAVPHSCTAAWKVNSQGRKRATSLLSYVPGITLQCLMSSAVKTNLGEKNNNNNNNCLIHLVWFCLFQ